MDNKVKLEIAKNEMEECRRNIENYLRNLAWCQNYEMETLEIFEARMKGELDLFAEKWRLVKKLTNEQ